LKGRMALDKSVFRTDLQQVIADDSLVMTWGTQSITVMVGDLDRADELENAGVFEDRDMTIQARVIDFTDSTVPEPNAKVVIETITYRVTRVMTGANRVMVTLNLQRETA